MENKMDKNWVIHPEVQINEKQFMPGDFVIIGEYLPVSSDDICPPTYIGKKPVIRSHTVIYAGNIIGDYFQTGHGVLIRENNRIGSHVSIGSHSNIEHDVQIGNHVRIHSNVFIPEYSILDDDCWVGPGVIFANAKYPRSKNVKNELIGPRIKTGAIIGAGAIIMPGITIGERALVGAGSVVTKDVLDGVVVVGNPARIVKKILDLSAYTD
jgi:acetyltransferase-like isoleucine patch superfamily enzyme